MQLIFTVMCHTSSFVIIVVFFVDLIIVYRLTSTLLFSRVPLPRVQLTLLVYGQHKCKLSRYVIGQSTDAFLLSHAFNLFNVVHFVSGGTCT